MVLLDERWRRVQTVRLRHAAHIEDLDVSETFRPIYGAVQHHIGHSDMTGYRLER